ncbi:MAG: sigma-70 family RNA polymerase sigma factor [Oscillospiraceae bacterium]|nr:sigma-70 family RNA polymerase sigma factor [Oscillospiraceae bacterium]
MQPNEEEFIEKLYRQYYAKIFYYVRVLVKNPETAEDIAQDTFHEAINKIDAVTRHPTPYYWLLKTAKNKALNTVTARQKLLLRIISLENAGAVPSAASVENQAIARVMLSRELKDFLGEDDYRFLQRAVFDGLSHAELAEEFGITVWASTKRLSRIKEKIKDEYGKD